MGLDYEYKIYLGKNKLKNVMKYIFEHCERQRSNLFFQEDTVFKVREENGQIEKHRIGNYGIDSNFDCCLIFPNDNKIWEYYLIDIAEGYELNTEHEQDSIGIYQVDSNNFWIGNIEVHIQDYSDKIPELIEIRFLAVTTRMSELFRDSISIDQFFKKLCKNVRADYGCLNKENEGYRLIWFEGEEKDLNIKLNHWDTFDKHGFIPIIKSILSKRKI